MAGIPSASTVAFGIFICRVALWLVRAALIKQHSIENIKIHYPLKINTQQRQSITLQENKIIFGTLLD